ncbi:MAG: ribonuclease PH [Bdellovibrionaceae bacterium]|nr:ribonuclease PH [Pseudobdellovibrionaceae bacterium]MDW8190745.1 ribonuclease PH [Pseudobdellovibrionaceae bacterium]
MLRLDGRRPDEFRPVQLIPSVNPYAEGSCLVYFGKTQVICTATYEQPAPKWVQGQGGGWVTAEYGMLPRSTQERVKRDRVLASGRTQEISRLIGRSLRAVVDLGKLPDAQIIVDCDVIVADGGTRTASVTGGFVALCMAIKKLMDVGEIKQNPIVDYVSAASVGLLERQILLDLNYQEDVAISTDMNFVMRPNGKLVEVQGTAEKSFYDQNQLMEMLRVAQKGCEFLFQKQREVLKGLHLLPD